jgi:hypothetical protein
VGNVFVRTTDICSNELCGSVTRELIGVLILAVLYKGKNRGTPYVEVIFVHPRTVSEPKLWDRLKSDTEHFHEE